MSVPLVIDLIEWWACALADLWTMKNFLSVSIFQLLVRR